MKLDEVTVLYAEDEPNLRSLISHILASLSIKHFVAKDGLEAYELYNKIKPDILLSDINMPYMSGLELCKKIRLSDQNIKIILLTAYSDVENLLKASELKLTKYLVKPFDGIQLLNAINDAIKELNNFSVVSTQLIKLDQNYSWNPQEEILFLNLEEVHLTPKEKRILKILFSKPNSTVSYDLLLTQVWDDYEYCTIDTLKTMMKNIRKKISKELIQNVYATRYKAIL